LKRCSRCGEEKGRSEFYRDASRKDGFTHRCKKCDNARTKTPEYKSRKRAYIKALRQTREYREHENAYDRARRQTPERKAYTKAQCQTPQRKAYQKSHYRRLSNNLRGRVRTALKGSTKTASTLDLIGCSASELRAHLEYFFTSEAGMGWHNFGTDWHVDHI